MTDGWMMEYAPESDDDDLLPKHFCHLGAECPGHYSPDQECEEKLYSHPQGEVGFR